jgi:hypothetical protein
MPKLKTKNIMTKKIKYQREFAMTATAHIASRRDKYSGFLVNPKGPFVRTFVVGLL